MAKCGNCGCTLECGICSNCQEELFISTFQQEYIDFPLSKEFTDKAAQQSKDIKNGVNK